MTTRIVSRRIINQLIQNPSFSNAAMIRTIMTPTFATALKTSRIKEALFRYPNSCHLISSAPFSDNRGVAEINHNGGGGVEHSEQQKEHEFNGGGGVEHSEQQKDHEFMKGPNPGLASVISQGIKSLEQTAEEIQYKTRKASLSRPHKKPSFRNGLQAEMDPRQLAEGQRILDVASDCLEQLALQEGEGGQQSGRGGSNGLVLFGEPIILLECEVNRNARQAKIYWTLPYGLLLDNRINQRLYQDIVTKVQKNLVENGGAKMLSRNVHTRLSHYYPPRIKLFPATDAMVQSAIEDFMV